MLATLLLPDANDLHMLDKISVETGKIVLKVTARQKESSCPACHTASKRVHSSYQRRLADLPCTGIPVVILWAVRRFFCDHPACARVTFVEQIPHVAARYARRTSRLHQQQTEIGFVVGGETGAKLANRLEIPTSADTLLRMVRKSPEQAPQTPKILGVDDWALCKGKTYGTLLIDLETRRPLDLLPERSAETLAEWLKAHPGIAIISRDRSHEYAKGATLGAPEAIQVADRFHLVKNLREALEVFLEQNRHCLRAAGEKKPPPSPTPMPYEHDAHQPVPTEQEEQALTKPEKKRQLIRQKRLERYHEVVELHARGTSLRTIARQLGLHRATVRKYIQAGEFPEMAERSKMPVKLDPYVRYLEERWQAGCRNRLQLWREICVRGFEGTHQLVYAWSKQQGFKKHGMQEAPNQDLSKRPSQMPKTKPWAAKRASWLLILDAKRLSQEERSAFARMTQAEPLMSTAHQLAQDFLRLMHDRQVNGLVDWMESARACGIEALKSFVNGLESDLKAVKAAFSLPWSNGPTEGNVNRLKLIKRQMYGRANFDLLRKRVLGMPAPT